jgi:hypothetical protein
MSRHPKLLTSPLLSLFLGCLLFVSQVACSPTQSAAVFEAAAAINNEVDSALNEPNELVFAGQVEDEKGRWLNNWESALSNEGPMDGVFELRITNIYKLTVAHDAYYYPERALVEMHTIPGIVGPQYLGTWHEDLNPADKILINVPSKQLEYALVVLPMPLDELPETHQPGSLTFQDGMLVIKQQENEPVGETAVPLPPPQSDIQFTVLNNENNGDVWRLQMNGYYGNRWDVWEQFVAGRGNGMSWETFKEAVLVYNPHLETDGYVFYPEKSYRLPFSQ